MTAHQLMLLPECAVPGCRLAVAEIGTPCPDCVTAFGPMLHHNPGGQRLTEADIERRDTGTHLAYAVMMRKATHRA